MCSVMQFFNSAKFKIRLLYWMIPQPEHSKQLQSQAFRSGDHGGQIVAEWRLTTLSLQKWRFSSCSTGTMQRGAILHRVVQSTHPCCYSAGMR
ncbi:hypothetical protein CDAR_3891 [Caerostris darwini]|uniref:Uncharacterized protein n=1 Tax=Caerostris darwini TaxID=1538125 RepID=A0AAV4T9Q1_9ARAC|nr:hypothetical protein CDAR_3891 [Caerostris darwini]